MIKVGITGQNGFIGRHLYNSLGLTPEIVERVEFKREFFDDHDRLVSFVEKCDVIVHLAALNRHEDETTLHDINIELVQKLVEALEAVNSKAHVVFSSSSQENRVNLYGASKKRGRELLELWSQRAGSSFTGLIVPNVFGPFGVPFYNSFVATFCYQLAQGASPSIENDSLVSLIYVNELTQLIISEIIEPSGDSLIEVKPTSTKNVSEVLNYLQVFRDEYQSQGIIPKLENSFEINLFNTFRSYINIDAHFPITYTQHVDQRGAFVEVIRLNVGGQVSFSTTKPGVTRGNHYHTRKIERFSVIKGKAMIQLRQIGTTKIHDLEVCGDQPGYVDMPVWYTHNITNIGTEELVTIFWINEFYDSNDPDTYFENV